MGLRVAFFGTPAFAVPTLRAIAASRHVVSGVVTQPDRPRGRGQKVVAAAVKQAALELGIPLLQPERIKTPEFHAAFSELRADIGVVAAYGKLLPQALLDAPQFGMINVHASLLPRWRGAAPVHRAILAGDRETGVTIMRVVLALDAGPMISRERIAIGVDERTPDLEARLASSGAGLAVKALDAIEAGTHREEPQDESLVTYAERIGRQDGQVDWSQPAWTIHDQIRGLQPWPLVSVQIGDAKLKLIDSRVVTAPSSRESQPGTVTAATRDGIAVATGSGELVVVSVQPEGRGVMTARDYLNGRPIAPGTRVGAVAFGA